jgi:hypothetical protein
MAGKLKTGGWDRLDEFEDHITKLVKQLEGERDQVRNLIRKKADLSDDKSTTSSTIAREDGLLAPKKGVKPTVVPKDKRGRD